MTGDGKIGLKYKAQGVIGLVKQIHALIEKYSRMTDNVILLIRMMH